MAVTHPHSKLRGVRGVAALSHSWLIDHEPKLDTDALYPIHRKLWDITFKNKKTWLRNPASTVLLDSI